MMHSKWFLSAAAFAGLLVEGTASAQQPVAQPAPQGAPVVLESYAYTEGNGGGASGGPIFGFEFLLLKPHFAHGIDSRDNDVIFDREFQQGREESGVIGFFDARYNYESAYRVTAGWAAGSGLAARVRYFTFNHTAAHDSINGIADEDNEGILNTDQGKLIVRAFDAEVTQAAALGAMNLNIGGGFRWGKVEEQRTSFRSNRDPHDTLFEGQTDFEGFGPTILLEVRRPLFSGALSLVANTRASVLLGNTSMHGYYFEPRNPNQNPPVEFTDSSMREHDDVVWVGELQLGLAYNRELSGGSVFVAQVLWEGQLWGGAVMDGMLQRPGLPDSRPLIAGASVNERATADGNLGLIGVSFGVGLNY